MDSADASGDYNVDANIEKVIAVGNVTINAATSSVSLQSYGGGLQQLSGNNGSDTLDSNGALGGSTMAGGAGADTFKFLFGDSSYLAYDSVNDFDRTLTTDQVFIGAGIASALSTANVVQALVGIGTPADIKSSLDQIYSGVPAPGVPSFAYSNLAAAHTKVTTVGAPSGVLFGVANPITGAVNYWALVEDGDGILTTNDLVINITQSALT